MTIHSTTGWRVSADSRILIPQSDQKQDKDGTHVHQQFLEDPITPVTTKPSSQAGRTSAPQTKLCYLQRQ